MAKSIHRPGLSSASARVCPKSGGRPVVIAGVVRGRARVAERLVGAAGRREIAALDRADELARLVDIAAGDEVELGEARRLEARGEFGGLDEAAGGGARRGGEGAEVGLEEAPARLVVIGEGAALIAVDAGRLAGLEVDVLDGLVVEAGIVGVRRDDDACRLLLRRCARRVAGRLQAGTRESERRAAWTTLRMDFLRLAPALEGLMRRTLVWALCQGKGVTTACTVPT